MIIKKHELYFIFYFIFKLCIISLLVGSSPVLVRGNRWLRMVFPGVRPFRAPIWCPSAGWRHARGREHCRGEPGGALSGRYAPDSAKAEGSSIVDEPGEG